VKAAERPYGEFYDFYRARPEYFGYTLVHNFKIITDHVTVVCDHCHQAYISLTIISSYCTPLHSSSIEGME
jgi:hypothetical protein